MARTWYFAWIGVFLPHRMQALHCRVVAMTVLVGYRTLLQWFTVTEQRCPLFYYSLAHQKLLLYKQNFKMASRMEPCLGKQIILRFCGHEIYGNSICIKCWAINETKYIQILFPSMNPHQLQQRSWLWNRILLFQRKDHPYWDDSLDPSSLFFSTFLKHIENTVLCWFFEFFFVLFCFCQPETT